MHQYKSCSQQKYQRNRQNALIVQNNIYLADELYLIGGSRNLTMSALCFVAVTHRPPHSSVHHLRSSIPGRLLPCLEQSATARYVCTLTACLPQPPQDSLR